MLRRCTLVAVSFVLPGVLSCAPASTRPDAAAASDASPAPDAFVPTDGSTSVDAAAPVDASSADAHAIDDAGASGRVCRGWTTERPLRVLFVGNSQIEVGNLPLVVSSLSQSAPPECPRIVGEAFARGGANLRDLMSETDAAGRTLAQRIATGGYDVVVISESIDLVELRPPFPEQFDTDARTLVGWIRAAGAMPILYASPYVERPDTTGFRTQADPQIALARAIGVRVAAAGLAWLRVWAVDPSIDLYAEDRAHPGYYGTYVSGLVAWATITGGDPTGLTDRPEADCWPSPSCSPIPARLLPIFQRAALDQSEETSPGN